MLNQFVNVGRIKEINKNGIIIEITRSYKNSEGIYETDLIPIVLKYNILDNAKNYCKIGDLVGTKGHIETKDNQIVLIAEKISFLASSTKKDEKANEE